MEKKERRHQPKRQKALKRPYDLSRRELQVLQVACTGVGSREAIAQVLNISPSTVRTHLAVIYEKLLVNRFADMVLLALRDPALRAVCFPEIKVSDGQPT